MLSKMAQLLIHSSYVVLPICACKPGSKVEKHTSSAGLREGSGWCEPEARGPAVGGRHTAVYTFH